VVMIAVGVMAMVDVGAKPDVRCSVGIVFTVGCFGACAAWYPDSNELLSL
jgi:hypothetical protein